MYQWLVTHIATINSLYILYDNFKSGKIWSVNDKLCGENLSISVIAWRLESKCETQFIEAGGMVPGALADQN